MRAIVLALLAVPLLTAAQVAMQQRPVPVVVLTSAPDLRSSVEQLGLLERNGMHVNVVAGEGCFVGLVDGALLAALRSVPTVTAVVDAQTPLSSIDALPPGQRIGIRYLNALLNGDFETEEVKAPMDWSAHAEEHALEAPHESFGPLQRGAGNRGGPAEATDWTCGNSYNSETMAGVIVASTFFIESNGTVDPDLYTWTQAHVDNVKLQVIDAWSIWSYTASLNATTVTAVMDWYEPSGGLSVQGFEPVTRPSTDDNQWIDAIMTNVGRTEYGAFGKLHGFNHDRRSQLGADRSFCAFVAYNPGAAPTQFTDGKIGYAYLGGPYTQILWKANGWSSSQIQRVYGHEVGHIFHAFDEYTASGAGNCNRSFNGRQNSNYQGSTCNGTAGCVMINNGFSGLGATRNWNLCSHTPYHLGWQGVLNTPLCNAPVNDSLITVNPFTLRWNRAGAPFSTFGYVKVHERTTDSLVYCGFVGQADTLRMSLVNGQYRWTISQGNSSTGSGYAGVLSTEALFTVNAPLNAAFTRNPSTLCAGVTVLYQNTSTGTPTSWSWSFPGGLPSTWTGKFPPPVRYDVPGTYPATLTVGDGLITDVETMTTAVTVTGGTAIPFAENFNGGVFPPAGWTAQSGGSVGQGGGGGLVWAPLAEPSCAQGTAANVPGHAYIGYYASPSLKTPRIDLTEAQMPYLRFRHSYARRSTTVSEYLGVVANNCNYSRYFEVYQKADSALATNTGGPLAAPAWMPQSCGEWRDNVVRLDSLKGHITELTFRFSTPGGGQDIHLDDVFVFEGVRLRSRVLLEGPLDVQAGLMSDVMRQNAWVPLVEPYTALGVSWVGEGGGESVAPSVLTVTGPDAIVDWVRVEVRDALDATKVLTSRAALLQRDGDVVETDGTSGVRLPVPAGDYHLAFLHRNHLGICTALPVAVSTTMPLLDLSQPMTPTWGTDARRISGVYAALWSGNSVPDGIVRYTGASNDRDAVLLRIGGLVPTATVTGYFTEDNTMDGVVKYTGSANDRDRILQTIGGIIPTVTRSAQLP
jgi:PKD repeat protein